MLFEPRSFDDARAYVEAMMETGEPFEVVERVIATTRLPEDEEAALWLVAWSLGERRGRPRPRRRLAVVPS